MQLTIFEDEHWQNFLPLSYLRPVFDLKCGVLKLRQKIEYYFPGVNTAYIVRKKLKDRYKEKFPDKKINTLKSGINLFINGRILINDIIAEKLQKLPINNALFYDGICIGFKTRIESKGDIFSENIAKLTADLSHNETKIKPIKYIWELVRLNGEEIISDSKKILHNKGNYLNIESSYQVINQAEVFVGLDTTVEPNVVLDASEGPVIIDDNATIMANAVLKGPVYIGKKSKVKVGAKIYEGTSVGKLSKVGGEVESTIIQSYSNKQHDGFLGHAYLGEWVNLGADTNNSDLKNNYKPVKVYFYPKNTFVSSESQFFGLIMGDHSKAGINTMFNTGCVVGVGCNCYAAELFSGFIPSFSKGRATKMTTYKLNKMYQTADIVKRRRDLHLTRQEEILLKNCFDYSQNLRKIFIRK